MAWEIVAERPEHYAGVRQALLDAFSPSEAEAGLIESIRQSRFYVPQLSFVVTVDDEVAGVLVLSHVGLRPLVGLDGNAAHPAPPARLLQLAPFGVRRSHQGRGLGRALMRRALRAAALRDEPVVLVVGDLAHYMRFGFEPGSQQGLVAPAGVAPERFLVRRLDSWDAGVRGQVELPPSFAGVTP